VKDQSTLTKASLLKMHKTAKIKILKSFFQVSNPFSVILNKISTGSKGVYKGNKPSTFLISPR
jgi:hypothetical protein